MARNTYKKTIINGHEYYYKQIELGWGVDGKRKRKVIRAKTVKELETKLKDYEKLNEGNNAATKDILFNKFMKDWLYNVHLKRNLKGSTITRYDGIYRNYLEKSAIGKLKMSKINSLKIQEFYSMLLKDGVTTSTIEFIHKLVRPCLQYAYKTGYTQRDFGANGLIILPKSDNTIEDEEEREVEVLTVEEQKQFIASLEEDNDRLIYLIALGTGLRLGELLGLKWDIIDLKEGTLKVRMSIKRVKDINTGISKIIEQKPKTKSSIRTVPIPSNLVKELKTLKLQQKKHKLSMGNLYTDNNLVFATNTGSYIEPGNLAKRFKKALTKANIKEIKFHSLRHTYATRLFENKVPLKTVSSFLGHADISTTANIYVHVLQEEKVKSAEVINNLFEIL